MRRREPTEHQRRLIRERARGRCEYCLSLETFSLSPFSTDHIVPVAAGGKTVLENLAHSCGGCNNAKQQFIEAIAPETQRIVPLFHPRRDIWSEHFFWSGDSLHMVGKTAIGRATVAALDLNRVGVVNIRRLLVMSGLHPPD
jgi:hypothetical protein